MKRIIIIGNSGYGKTWLGERIAALLGIPPIGLDSIFWEPGGYNRKKDEQEIQADLKRIQASDSWLAEGVFGHLFSELIAFADTLIYTGLTWEQCRKNLINRGSESSRQLDPKKAEKNFQALLDWASVYEIRNSKASKNYHSTLFDGFVGDKHRVRSRDEADPLLKRMSANHVLQLGTQKAAPG
jgi:adenylate kinase family enzyme